MLTSACIALLTLVSEARVRGRRHSPQRTIDVVVLANPTYAAGVAAAINSSRVHSSAAIRFYVGYDGDPLLFKKYLDCVGVDGADVCVAHEFGACIRSACYFSSPFLSALFVALSSW